jgi:hypothetical protein
MPASPGAITNSALLLLLLVLLVLVLLPGFFELLTQLEVLLGQECLAGCLAAQVDIRRWNIRSSTFEASSASCLCRSASAFRRCATRSASDTASPPRLRCARKVDAVGRHGREGCQLPIAKTMRSAYLVRSSGKAAGCGSTSVPGAMAPVTDNPPEGYTRYRAPSAPDERLSRTRGSPVGRLAGVPGMRGRPTHSLRRGVRYGGAEPMACPVSPPFGAGTGAFFLPGFGVHPTWRPGPGRVWPCDP